MTRIERVAKRTLDLIAAVLMLLLFAIPFFLLGLAIKLEDAGPVFFRHQRAGKGGKLFRVWKLRSMVVGAERMGAGHGFVKDDPRITSVGRFLRGTGLDELPQLYNVLLGQMSLVGPRPALPHQVAEYSQEQRRRLSVRPGITGLALIRGRNEIPWSKRISYDLEYIDRCSVWLDLRILAETIKVVGTRRGLRMDQRAEDVEDFSNMEDSDRACH